MRTLPTQYIWNLWNRGGPFIGNDRANAVVTVETSWKLRKSTSSTIGTFNKGPIRWFQRADNSQVETIIPNVRTIQIDRSLESDAATCRISLRNQWHYENGQIAPDDQELGEPGYFTFNRGLSSLAQARWGYTENAWAEVLVPNALIRTYQGYGGHNKTISQAIADGNLVLTGVWLVDSVQINTDGTLQIECRDMSKLLIEQMLYPPLVPKQQYPLEYYRWKIRQSAGERIPYGQKVGPDLAFRQLTYAKSTSDVWFGYNGSPENRDEWRPTASLDGNPGSLWLSPGNTTASLPSACEFIEYTLNDTVDAVFITPTNGNYDCYISVMEDGVWQGSQTVPHDPTIAGAYVDAYDTRIPYVQKVGIPYELTATIRLPRTYRAQRIRLSFTNLAASGIGTAQYRVGIREVSAGLRLNLPDLGKKILGMAGGRNVSSYNNGRGYWLVGDDGGVFTFGLLEFWGSLGGNVSNAVAMAANNSNTGYWLLRRDGQVHPYNVPAYGQPADSGGPYDDFVAIETTVAGSGYYCLSSEGEMYSFGDAVYYGNGATGQTYTGLAVGNGGYWLLRENGYVEGKGACASVDLTPFSSGEAFVGITPTPSHNGFYVVDIQGRVYTYGDAVYRGDLRDVALQNDVTDIEVDAEGDGYWIVAEDGGVFTFGEAEFHGSLPGSFSFSYRLEGNYKDYSDIIKELLLWAGWWLYTPSPAANQYPDVYGNIESTGIYSDEPLPKDMFDKKPVIDAINQIKEIVGYIAYTDEEGAFRFESPNLFKPGNFFEDGRQRSFIPIIDESYNITDYSVSYDDRPVRSKIIISSNDPIATLTDTVTVEYQPDNIDVLKGLVRVGMWINDAFSKQEDAEVMAEMIGLFSWLAQRQGSVTCVANPAIQLNDQVRIMERQTSEVYIHYVRGITTSQDLQTGEYLMTLTTHWMGDKDAWAVAPPATPPVPRGLPPGGTPTEPPDVIPVPPGVVNPGTGTTSDPGGSSTSGAPGGTGSVWWRTRSSNPTGPKKTLATTVNGDYTTTSSGQHIDATKVTGVINVAHNNVTITHFDCQAVNITPGCTGTVLEDGLIRGGWTGEAGVVYSNYTMRRVEVRNTFDGLKGHGDVLIEDSWIHDMARGGGSAPTVPSGSGNSVGGYTHNDGIQISSGSNITIRRSRFENTGYNSGIFIDPDQGNISNVLIEDSYMQGGNFAVFAVASATAPSNTITNCIIRGCIMGAPNTWAPSYAGYSKVYFDDATNPSAFSLTFENNLKEIRSGGSTVYLTCSESDTDTPAIERWRT